MRPTTASPWWTSARPSLRTSNSSGLRLRATADHLYALCRGWRGCVDPTDNSFSLVDITSTIDTDPLRLSNGKMISLRNKMTRTPWESFKQCIRRATLPPLRPTARPVTAPSRYGIWILVPTDVDEGYSVTGTCSCIAGTLTAALCLTTCSRSSSLADVCCVDGTPHALESGVDTRHFVKYAAYLDLPIAPLIGRINRIMVVRAASAYAAFRRGTVKAAGNRRSSTLLPLSIHAQLETANHRRYCLLVAGEAVSSLCCVDQGFHSAFWRVHAFFLQGFKRWHNRRRMPERLATSGRI